MILGSQNIFGPKSCRLQNEIYPKNLKMRKSLCISIINFEENTTKVIYQIDHSNQ